MFGKRKTEVAIIGAGPVGLMSALTLNHAGVNTLVLETEPSPEAHSYALALHPQTLAILADCGVLDPIMEKARKVSSCVIHDHKTTIATLQFGRPGDRFPYLAVLGQNEIEAVLESVLIKRHVPVLRNHRVVNIQPEEGSVLLKVDELEECLTGYAVARLDWLTARTHNLEAQFVIGADGHNSITRRLLKLDFPACAEASPFAVFEFKSDWNHSSEVQIILGEGTTSVLWPMPNGGCRWSFQLDPEQSARYLESHRRPASTAGGFPALDVDMLKSFISERAPWFNGSIRHLYWSTLVRFDNRMVNRFGVDRVWLAGDAAHLTGPVGVQSMNVGIREAQQLATTLSSILRSGDSLSTLENYNNRALAEWNFLLGQTGKLVVSDSTHPSIRTHLHRILPMLPGSGDSLDYLAGQLGINVQC